jgi:LMBR1-like membrane protein
MGIIIALVTIVLSFILFFGEVTIFVKRIFLGVFMEKLSRLDNGLGYLMTFTILLLSYMAVLCYFGVFYLKIFGFYGFWEKQTIGVTLLNSAYYASKMTFPMTFNFMYIFFKTYESKTDFVRVKIF